MEKRTYLKSNCLELPPVNTSLTSSSSDSSSSSSSPSSSSSTPPSSGFSGRASTTAAEASIPYAARDLNGFQKNGERQPQQLNEAWTGDADGINDGSGEGGGKAKENRRTLPLTR